MGKKVDSVSGRMHLSKADGVMCGWKGTVLECSNSFEQVTCVACLRAALRVPAVENAKKDRVKASLSIRHLEKGNHGETFCGGKDSMSMMLLEGSPDAVTCPKCLLAWGKGIAKQLGVENTRANQAAVDALRADQRAEAAVQRAEDADKAWKQAQNEIMKAWGVANKRLEEIVEITAREQNARAALLAVMKLV